MAPGYKGTERTAQEQAGWMPSSSLVLLPSSRGSMEGCKSCTGTHVAVLEEHAECLCITGAAEGWSAEPCSTHHGAHHPANINRVIAMRAVQVLILQEFGVDVQHLEADGQDLIFKLV